MEMLFAKQDSKSIEARLTELKVQLTSSEALVNEKESALEQAIAAGSNSDKVLDDLGKARSRVAALKSVIEKGEPELQAALDREARARERERLAALAKSAAAAMVSIRAKKEKLLEAAAGCRAPVTALDAALGAVQDLCSASGLNIFVGIPVDRNPVAGAIEGRLQTLPEFVEYEATRFEKIKEGLCLAITKRLAELSAQEDCRD